MGTVITILDAAVYTDEPADGQRRHTYASRAADAQTIACAWARTRVPDNPC